jgi:hypothetical protein
LAGKTNALISKVIFPELKVLYGTRKGCAVWLWLDNTNLLQVHALSMMRCFTFVTCTFNFQSLQLPASYYRSNTKLLMLLWHYQFQMLPEICRSQDCVCMYYLWLYGHFWIFFTDFSYYLSTQMALQFPVYQTLPCVWSLPSCLLFCWGGRGVQNLNVFEKSRGSETNSAHTVLFVTHVRGNWTQINNERVPCFCNWPDITNVIKLMGNWCRWDMQLCSGCSRREEICIRDFDAKI